MNNSIRNKRGLSGLILAGAVLGTVLAGPAASASAAPIADDGCTFSSVGGSCSDPGPVGHALIAVKEFAKSLGYGTGSSSGTAYFL
ncbi:hypothetical protein [Nocardia sp. NPDC050717]|uniref:hypothetical protein n=1 Tax=Nocardia sp. NPDC050717 TaxID=3157221 RepID=UPI0033EDFA5D